MFLQQNQHVSSVLFAMLHTKILITHNSTKCLTLCYDKLHVYCDRYTLNKSFFYISCKIVCNLV